MKLKDWLKTEKNMTQEEFKKLPAAKQKVIREEFNAAHREDQLKKNKKKEKKTATDTMPKMTSKNQLVELLEYYKGKYDYASLHTAKGEEYRVYLKDVYMVIRNAVLETISNEDRYISHKYERSGYEYYCDFPRNDCLEFVETNGMSGQLFESRIEKAIEVINEKLDYYNKNNDCQGKHISEKEVTECLNRVRHNFFQKIPETSILAINTDYIIFSNLFSQETANNWSLTNPNSYYDDRSAMFRFNARKMDDDVAFRLEDIAKVVPHKEKLALRNKEVIKIVQQLI